MGGIPGISDAGSHDLPQVGSRALRGEDAPADKESALLQGAQG